MPKGKRYKTVFMQMKVTPEFKEAVRERAFAKHRSLTGYIESLVYADLEQAEKSDLTNKPK